MNLVAIVLALALEQWRAFRWRGGFVQLFRRYARTLERRFNAGAAQQGAIAGALALAPAVVLATGVYWGLDQISALLGFVWNVAILLRWRDWIPVRLTAMPFAVVGDFEDAVYCWHTQAKQWPSLHDGILLASGAGALGCAVGGILTTATGGPEFRPELGLGDTADADSMPSATGLAWRALLIWLVLLLLLTLAYWAP